ncbi:hypothetical protein HanPI659440_Chr08g0294371 [Helianthus annuus]|nr:hypothetical protein HanPI659440_Chr08g0294371 [Helianthus annuus]
MTKFTAEVLTNYRLHISQINALGLPRLTHFEFICKANRLEPTFEMFNVFYFVSYTSGFYSINARTSEVIPYSSHPPQSLHDWKQKFFYILRGVILVDMHYRAESEGVPKINVFIAFAEQEWYKTLTRKATPISQLEERALVGAGMSMLWVPKNPRGVPVYGYQGRVGYSLLNVLDPKAASAMIVAIIAEGKPVWLDQIWDRFLHPTSDSFASYANTILGEDDGSGFDDTTDPTREEVIVPSSEGSERPREGLTSRSPHAGPVQEAANEPVNEPVDKEEKLDNLRRRGRRLREMLLKLLRTQRDPDDDETLTKIVKKKKVLEEKKKELDEQAAAALASKKAKLQKETPPAPSESEIDLDVLSAKRGNILEKIYAASGSQGGAAGGVGDTGGAGGDGRGKGVETEAESSEATPRHTIYTKHPPGSGGGATSGVPRSPKYKNVQAGSWDTHNPACAADQNREQEYVKRIGKLEKFGEEKIAKSKASEILVEEVTADWKWLLTCAVPLIAERIAGSEELAKYMYDLGEAAYAHGRKEGYAEGRAAAEAKEPLKNFELNKTDCAARYAEKRQEFESLEFGVVKAAGKLSRKPNGIALLKKALGDEDHETGGAGTSYQE